MYDWLLFLALVGNVYLGLYTLYLDRASRLNGAFALLAFSLAVWVLGAIIQGASASFDWASNALFGLRVVYSGVILIFLSFFYFTRVFPSDRSKMLKNRLLVSSIIAYCVITFSIVWSSQFISAAYLARWGFLEKTEALYPLIYLIIFGIGASYLDLVLLYFKSSSEMDRQRVKYILMGGFFPLLLGSVNIYLVSTGGGDSAYMSIPLAPLSTLVSAALIYYGVTKYRILSFTPSPERAVRKAGKYALSPGNIYLFREEHRVKTADVFKDLISQGYAGLLVTRSDPEDTMRKYGIGRTPLVWLSDKKKAFTVPVECINPKNLNLLYFAVRGFASGGGRIVVCLTQSDALFDANNIEAVREFLDKVGVIARAGEVVLLIHVDPSNKNAAKITELLPEIFDVTKLFAKHEEVERLREMISSADKKYRKREINEKVFEDIMRDYEEKLIGIEVDYKKLAGEMGFTIREDTV